MRIVSVKDAVAPISSPRAPGFEAKKADLHAEMKGLGA